MLMAKNYLHDKESKRKPHLLYAVFLLIVGLAFVASWTYVRNKELEMQKQQQQLLNEAAAKKELEEKRLIELRNVCLAEAERDYKQYLEVYGQKIKRKDGSTSYRLPQHQIDFAFKKLNDAEELCLQKYPILK
jgi:hypothetical protein